MTIEDELARCYREQRMAATAILTADGYMPGLRLWLSDWVAEEIFLHSENRPRTSQSTSDNPPPPSTQRSINRDGAG